MIPSGPPQRKNTHLPQAERAGQTKACPALSALWGFQRASAPYPLRFSIPESSRALPFLQLLPASTIQGTRRAWRISPCFAGWKSHHHHTGAGMAIFIRCKAKGCSSRRDLVLGTEKCPACGADLRRADDRSYRVVVWFKGRRHTNGRASNLATAEKIELENRQNAALGKHPKRMDSLTRADAWLLLLAKIKDRNSVNGRKPGISAQDVGTTTRKGRSLPKGSLKALTSRICSIPSTDSKSQSPGAALPTRKRPCGTCTLARSISLAKKTICCASIDHYVSLLYVISNNIITCAARSHRAFFKTSRWQVFSNGVAQ